MEFAIAVAAEERGIRHVRIRFGLAATEEFLLDMSTTVLESFRPGLTRQMARSEHLTLFPRVLDESPFGDTRRYRLPNSAQPGGSPDWWHGNRDPLMAKDRMRRCRAAELNLALVRRVPVHTTVTGRGSRRAPTGCE